MKNSIAVKELSDSWHITAVDLPLYLSHLLIDRGGVIFCFCQPAREGYLSIRISGSFVFSTEENNFNLEAELPKEIGPVFDLLNCDIASVIIQRKGSMEISFSGNNKIVVLPDLQYEAWHVCVDDSEFICKPGDGVTVLGPK